MSFYYRISFLCLIVLCTQLVFAQPFTSSDLPIVIIDTNGEDIPDEPKIDAQLGIIDNGPGQRNFLTDLFNEYNGMIGIEKRGSSSQGFPKKQYALETRKPDGSNNNVSIFGMPSENDWVLYAPYSDKSLMRNVLTFKLGNDLGGYASRTRFCEVVLNGEYQGLYVWMEKIKRDNGRVAITKLEPEDISGDALTGGYVIKIDKTTGASIGGWISPFLPHSGGWQETLYQFHHPDVDDLVPQQEAYIEDYITQFETMMDGSDYTHPFLGYYDRLDMDSAIDFLIINEISKNVDGYRLSSFLYKDRDSVDGRLVIGPLWDFNLAFGNADYYNGSGINGWQHEFYQQGDGALPPFWWDRLWADPVFRNRLSERWLALRQTTLHTDSIFAFMDDTYQEINEARIRNFQKWQILGHYVWPNNFVGQTYDEEFDYMKNWIRDRINWVHTRLLQPFVAVEWQDPAQLSWTVPVNEAFCIAESDIALSAQNADGFSWLANDPAVTMFSSNDSIYITATEVGDFLFKGQAIQNNEVKVISPAYSISASNAVGIGDEPISRPRTFRLLQNFPNPFNGTTQLRYELAAAATVSFDIFNAQGQRMLTFDSGPQKPGIQTTAWNGRDAQNRPVSSGIYLYRLTINELETTISHQFVGKMLHVK